MQQKDLSKEFMEIFSELKPANKEYAMAILRSLQFAQSSGPDSVDNGEKDAKSENDREPT